MFLTVQLSLPPVKIFQSEEVPCRDIRGIASDYDLPVSKNMQLRASKRGQEQMTMVHHAFHNEC